MVLSGGITRLHVPNVPAGVQFTVALVIEVPYFELDQPHEVRLTVIDPETAGPTARAALNSKEFRAMALMRSTFGTKSGTKASLAGMSID